mmetsp:Transcript_36604/g.82059  ORF Transcript_36604/g.82059 Transcript_36604/m.82059 type:complete len:239 (+) Transcript_36604:140-856(+)
MAVTKTVGAMPMYLFLVIYVVLTTGLPAAWHSQRHGVISATQVALAFFLGLNAIVCVWEMCLFFQIDLIERKHATYSEKFKGKALKIAYQFFTLGVGLSNVFTSELWAEVWATYSVFDPSYANRQSFGFFVDVGNGFTTLLPTLVFMCGMTAHGSGGFELPLSARNLGVLGMVSFYQEFYGTCIYFLSFILNRRYKNLKAHEIVIFVCFTNGLWFFLPLLGMKASWDLIQTDSFDTFL